MSEFKIDLIAGERTFVNGRTVHRIVLTVDGEQKSVERVTLDSPRAIDKAVDRWAEDYGIDGAIAVEQLRAICVNATAESIERQQRAKARAAEPKNRVSELADAFVASLSPAWHRNGKSMYLERVSREVPIAQLWTLGSAQK